jgi:hypothetical protein
LPAAEQQAEALQLSMWQWYCRALDQWPLLSRVATGVVGTITSDLLAQLMEGRQKGRKAQAAYDAARTARLVLYSALVGTPLAHFWFQYLDMVRPAARHCCCCCLEQCIWHCHAGLCPLSCTIALVPLFAATAPPCLCAMLTEALCLSVCLTPASNHRRR